MRRNDLSKMTPAEKAIYDAIGEVEKVGADPKLTDIGLQLQKAKDLLSDFLESDAHTNTSPIPVNGKCPSGYYTSPDGSRCILDV